MEPLQMTESDTQQKRRIPWYRSKVERELLAQLNRRSDMLGFAQTLGFLGTLAATGALAWWSTLHLAWYCCLPLFFLHGICYAFIINGFHELVHSSVFRSQPLNVFFLYVLSFLGWYNPVHFWASHTEHHKYTLHPPEDGEVVLPVYLTLRGFLRGAFFDPLGAYNRIRGTIRRGFFGHLNPGWDQVLFPAQNLDARRRLFRWDRIMTVGHVVLVAGSLYLGWWQLPVLVTFGSFYGGFVFLLCNNAQHIGMTDKVSDFRLCTRTIILNPLVRFLYWHMNYHIEHHMYAAVPCYRLGRLHKAIRHDLPDCPVGLISTWRGIAAIQTRQKSEPEYQFTPVLPASAG
jgi:fatty acid desaturase|tara:strand:- start:20 stop:1054 length:1035 start_codon:yes stop_codon:yes gene_type:complete